MEKSVRIFGLQLQHRTQRLGAQEPRGLRQKELRLRGEGVQPTHLDAWALLIGKQIWKKHVLRYEYGKMSWFCITYM